MGADLKSHLCCQTLEIPGLSRALRALKILREK